MIPMPEEYIAELLINRLDFLRKNLDYIDRILRMSDEKRNMLKAFLRNTPIKVIKAYPRTPSELPCVCILLSKEETSQIGLGDYNSDEDYNIQEVNTESHSVIFDAVGAQYGFPYIKTEFFPVYEVASVINHSISDDPLTRGVDYEIWDEDKGVIALYGGMVEEDDDIEISYSYRKTSLEEVEVISEANYRIECWGLNGDFVVQLYHIIKWALLSGRDSLIEQYDLFNQRIGGGDFEPATGYFPEFVYRRAISFWCQFKSSIPKEEIPYIEQVYVNEATLINLGGAVDGRQNHKG